ncbi:NIPSNAP family protein [Maribacter hydrothermalis]|uniref:NIPSNAP family containing protein n=1 Tax=Maribacter hydrothermalis TaxID=1836467 RepID=A0A1B7Z149_9FLAO|nr:NIPSNAP family protein [Maribacter hydrothermalis]APQ18093.1 NIPSNAP family containing protein [Maribacter hydrothermalis]OBR36439.1 NIPSNAP family containing protein [Maribacter hydrothermalis]
MKNKTPLPMLVLLIALITNFSSFAQEKEYYELKTYTIKNEAQEHMVDDYLKNAYLPALKRMGIENIGVFKVRPDKFKVSDKIYVLIPFQSLVEFDKLEAMLAVDKTHLSAGAEYIHATHDKKPFERISSVLLRAFPDMPKMKPSKVEGSRTDRVYELRSYEGPTEAMYRRKVDMFNEGGEVELFDSLGFNAVFYADVISGDKMPNLMYMTTFTNMEKRNALWKDFVDSDKWKEISVMDKYLNTVSHADIHLLYPTAYSDY